MPRGRPRKPTAVLELSGAFKKDPKRKQARKQEPKAKGKIGPYPGSMKKSTEKDAYDLIVSLAPEGVLTEADQLFVYQMAQILHASWQGFIKSADRQQLLAGFSKLGMNPSDRTRLQIPESSKPKNRWSDVE